MKTYRLNSVMTGVLYFGGTLFGVMSAVVGGDVMSSLVQGKPLEHLDLASLHSPRILLGSFFILMMGISLTAMTLYLYPVLKKDSEELAMGMLLFRGALEGAFYMISTISILGLYALGRFRVEVGEKQEALQTMADALYGIQDFIGPIGTIFFLIGATCIYVSFYRTRLIPRWLSVWGLVGVFPYMTYAILHMFNLDHGIGLYLQMLLAPQEVVMAIWLIVKGFDRSAMEILA